MDPKPGSVTRRTQAATVNNTHEEDARQLQRQITDTRAAMSETLDAIQERVKPRNIANRAMQSVKASTMSRMRTFADTASATATLQNNREDSVALRARWTRWSINHQRASSSADPGMTERLSAFQLLQLCISKMFARVKPVLAPASVLDPLSGIGARLARC